MNLNLLRPGHRVGTRDGREAEVIGESPEGDALRVVYLVEEGPFGIRERTRAEELLGGGEVETLLGAEPPVSWRERLAVVLHYVPESEEDPAEYRPETLSGVPNGVKAGGGAPHKRRSTISSEACGLWASWNS